MSRPIIAILMATYNGEKYVRQQIQSIQRQTVTEWTLYVRDDLSTDRTLEIVQEMAAADPRIIITPSKTKQGAMMNFLSLLRDVKKADYYMFSDQDDVWMEDKIAVTLAKIKEAESAHPDKAVVVHTDLKVVDGALNEIHPSFWEYARVKTELLTSLKWMSGGNLATGCTMMLNEEARLAAFPISDKALMHDAWIVLTTMRDGGTVTAVKRPTILYRQHGTNTLGAKRPHRSLCSVINKLSELFTANKKSYQQLHEVGYGGPLTYIYYKLRYLQRS